MRLTAVIIFLAAVQVSASSFGQKVTYLKKDVALVKLFKEIKKQTGYNVVWYEETLDASKIISARFKDASIEEVMGKALSGMQLAYTISKNTIVIKEKERSFLDKISDAIHSIVKDIDVRGKITDEYNKPLKGATVKIKGTQRSVITDENGNFYFENVKEKAVLVISYLGYKSMEIEAAQNLNGIQLVESMSELAEVQVMSTGYQSLIKERTTGSFVQIDNKLLTRSVSTNVLDRIKDVVPGVYVENSDPQIFTAARAPNQKNTGITIRGESTFAASKQPLIILDNFPYEGEIRNINPNDIESITILKDASAASIWGARSANGVIVLTTKKGKLNQKMTIDFSSNITLISKPDLKKSLNFLDSKSYIEVEQFLFDKGFFDSELNNTISFPAISPAVELMSQYKNATTDSKKALIQSQLDLLKTKDVRDDYTQYVYQKAVNQQYSLGIRGGTDNITYTLSIGRDNNKNSLIRNGYNRTSIASLSTYKPIKNLEITAGINYSISKSLLNNDFPFGKNVVIGTDYGYIPPYSSLVDEKGNALPISQNLRMYYLESMRDKGFLDWKYRPIDEIKFADNETKVSDLLLRFGIKYQILSKLSFQANYQNERQIILGRNYRTEESYYTRNLINQFSQYDNSTGNINYIFPKGGILDLQSTDWFQNNLRGQINYDSSIGKHSFNAVVGAEIKELKTEGFNRSSYGYNDQFGTASNALNYNTYYPINPTGSNLIIAPDGSIFGNLNRNISYYALLGDIYDNKYSFNFSLRKDGANLFGAKINDKIKPFWSAGLGWDISKEMFYNVTLLSYLRLRATYGYQGNTYDGGTAYLTGYYSNSYYTGAKYISIINAPNPRLQWENIKNINLAIDFVSKNSIISGTIEVYQKDGRDLIQPTPLASQTGFSTYQANTARAKTLGIDVNLQSQNLNGLFKWRTTLLISGLKDKVIKYGVTRTNLNSIAEGYPINSLFSYKWAGLNHNNGNPQGYLNGQISEDYASIVRNIDPDSLIFNGSRTPRLFGAFRNDFSYHRFSLSINISYQFKYVFNRSSTDLNYISVLQTGQHKDYQLRWQKPGDENKTNVPSLSYPGDINRNTFYQSSNILVQPGDHIRLQDVRFGYELPTSITRKIKATNVNLFVYGSNLGIIWRKNNLGIDPSNIGYPPQTSISFGLTANF